MTLRKKKKQLIAAVLTLALSLGGAVPALSAAPAVMAALPTGGMGYGSMMLDTANYIMAPGNIYDIGVTIKDGNGKTLSASQVRELFSAGDLTVRDSRNGSIANLTQLTNGNFRVTAKNPGTCYIVYEGGGNHASVKIDVQRGVTQHGCAVRHTSYFTRSCLNHYQSADQTVNNHHTVSHGQHH